MLDQLQSVLLSHSLDLNVDWNTKARNGSQWCFAYHVKENGEDLYYAHFGDFKKDGELGGNGVYWHGFTGNLSPKEYAQYAKAKEAMNAKMKDEKLEVYRVSKLEHQKTWEEASQRGWSPYFTKKQITDIGCRYQPSKFGTVALIPGRDVDGELWTYQRIYPQKFEDSGTDKFMAKGGKKDGCFHLLREESGQEPPPKDGDAFYICEGYATAASVHLALGRYAQNDVGSATQRWALCAFDAGNLLAVAQSLRTKFPRSSLILCADNDAIGKDGKTRDYNIGVRKASAAAKEVNGTVLVPTFKTQTYGVSDFNDLHCLDGLDEVVRQLFNKTEQEVKTQANLVKPPQRSQADVAKQFLLAHPFLRKSDKDLFGYDEKVHHWILLEDNAQDLLKIELNKMLGEQLTVRQMGDLWRMIRTYIKPIPAHVNMFTPKPKLANFQNGVLQIVKVAHNKYDFTFTPHAPNETNTELFLTSTIPLDCPSLESLSTKQETPLFDAFLDRAFKGQSDAAELKVACLEAIGCAILAPASRVFMFYGKPATGKSTFIKLAEKFIDQRNISSQPPHKWGQDFGLEPMINKLVNVVTELPTHKAVALDQLKMLFDERPVSINRKGQRAVQGHLPMIHLFATNQLPPMVDLMARSLDRRMTFILMNNPIVKMEQKFDELLWDSESGGILIAALNAAKGVMERDGEFTSPGSSVATMREVEVESDVIAEFFEDVVSDDIACAHSHLILDQKGRIEQPNLWAFFKDWCEDRTGLKSIPVGKRAFFRRVEAMGFQRNKSNGVRYINGILTKAKFNARV